MAEKSRFQLRMIGERVTPETVRAGDLADLVADLEAAIIAANPEPVDGVDIGEATVSLVGIEAGSNRLTFAVLAAALPWVGAITEAISSDRCDRLPARSHERLHKISKQAERKGWAIEFDGDRERNIAEATISAEHPVPPPTPSVATGQTTIWGRLMRVGGAKPRAEIRLPDNNLLYFDLSEQLAKELSEGLYETVSVEGVATWDVDSGSLTDFKATRILSYRPEKSNLVRAFEELAAASKGRWDGVDAARYVDELRSED